MTLSCCALTKKVCVRTVGLPELVDHHVDEPWLERAPLLVVLLLHRFLLPWLLPNQLTRVDWGAAAAAASRAIVTSPASKLALWQFGAFRSPSSVCAATVQPPAQTGMNAQSSHCFQAASCSNLVAALWRHVSCRPSICPVDIRASPVNPGHAYNAPSGPMVCACFRWISHGPMWTPSTVANPRFIVSSRRKDIFSSMKLQLSQMLVPPPADVMQVPFSGFASVPTAFRAMNFPAAGCGAGSARGVRGV